MEWRVDQMGYKENRKEGKGRDEAEIPQKERLGIKQKEVNDK